MTVTPLMSVNLKYAVLGLLAERRGYGYELARRLDRLVGPAFRLNPSAIYAALDALMDDGMVRGSYDERDDGPSPRRQMRVIYEATDGGVEAYESWLRTPVRLDPLRGELELRVALARAEHAPELLRLIDDYERQCVERLRQQTVLAHDDEEREGWELSAIALARARSVRLLNAEIAWVAELRESLQALA